MRKMQRARVSVLSSLCLLAVMALLAGCQSYLDGSRRTVGEFTDDAGIQAAVKTALINEQEVSGLAINVEVSRSVVSLYGRIDTESARRKAVQLARAVRGVVRVEDRLTLVEAK